MAADSHFFNFYFFFQRRFFLCMTVNASKVLFKIFMMYQTVGKLRNFGQKCEFSNIANVLPFWNKSEKSWKQTKDIWHFKTNLSWRTCISFHFTNIYLTYNQQNRVHFADGILVLRLNVWFGMWYRVNESKVKSNRQQNWTTTETCIHVVLWHKLDKFM